jgi:hypothetical protein
MKTLKFKNSALLTFVASLVASTSLTFILVACGDDDSSATNKPDSGTSSSGGTDGAASSSGDAETPPPPAPTLGAQVDRMGRPAINTALNNTFNPDTTSQGTAKDGYNANKDPSAWVAAYKAEMAKNLAIYDSLDTFAQPGDRCGNQLLAADAGDNIGRYGALAGVLADDRLYLNTGSTTCEKYLAVETAQATDCGGRTLKYDVIKVTYGAISGADGFDDAIDRDSTKTDGMTFPYLASP